MSKSIKIGVFGGGGTNKTDLSIRYLKGEFTEGYIPTIDDEFSKVVDVDGEAVNLAIIDTAGQDDFAEMAVSYYCQVQGMVFVFSIDNQASIDQIINMYKDAKDMVDDIKCFVAANNGHLRDENRDDLVPVEEYKKIENELNCKVFETSAITGENVYEMFNYLIKLIIKPGKESAKNKNETTKKESKKVDDDQSGGCCLIE